MTLKLKRKAYIFCINDLILAISTFVNYDPYFLAKIYTVFFAHDEFLICNCEYFTNEISCLNNVHFKLLKSKVYALKTPCAKTL